MPAPYVKSVLEDQSTRISTVNSFNVGVAIDAKKGPYVPTLITNQTQFLTKYTPNGRIEIGWDEAYWHVYMLLRDTGRVWVVRTDNTGALYGGCVIKLASSQNENYSLTAGVSTDPAAGDTVGDGMYTGSFISQEDDAILIYGLSKGKFSDNITVRVVPYEGNEDLVKLEGAFLLYVYNNGVLAETHTCSTNPSLKNGYGVNCFVETVLEGSNYVRAVCFVEEDDDGNFENVKIQEEQLQLRGGNDGDAATPGQYVQALKKFNNVNDVPLQLLIDGGQTIQTVHSAIYDVCTARGETTLGILSTPYTNKTSTDAIADFVAYKKESGLNNYLTALYGPHCKIYDEFNDRYVYVAASCFVAGAIAKTVRDYGWHWPAAGYNRGILNVLDVATPLAPTEVDDMSDNQVNTLVKDPDAGIVIYDQLTTQVKASDLQEVSISGYINCYLRPALKEALKYYLFELNDEETRTAITTLIDTFMKGEKANRAVYDYKVVCDETNNLDTDIENNKLNAWLYVKPTKPAKFIEQRVIVTPYSVDLESISA